VIVKSLVGAYLENVKPFCQQLCLQGNLGELQLTAQHFREIEFLYQSISVVKCFKLAVSALRSCNSQTSLRQAADLVSYAEGCRMQIAGTLDELPELRKEVRNSPKSGEAHAALGFALNHLDDDDGALSAFREALKYAGTESLSFISHRDCLNNLGWHSLLQGEYEQAIVWFDQACWMSPDPEDFVDDIPADELQPPYRLAFENLLLCLAKLANVPEAQKCVLEYCSHFGRVPRYESDALLSCGVDADRAYIECCISRSRAG
jgi:tetratricopeptide (TPR) repeat protein